MARSVSVSLRANVAPFVSGMRTAAGAVGSLERRINTSTGAQRQALQSVGRTGTVMAAGLVGGFLLSVRASMQFEKQMSAVKAAANATSGEMQQLSAAAIDAGKKTAYSATEAAKAQEELVKAGVSVKDILGGGLKGALDLASAGQLEVGEAAETAATAMTQFNLAGKDVPHIADLLAAGAGKAQGDVHDLGYALKMGGLVANQFGVSVEDTVGTLSAFASAGLLGSDSGTSFKTMLLHLAKPSEKAASLMEELGINAYDASGQFVGITGLAGQLQTKLGGLTQAQRDNALATIFGTDAIRGANVLFKQGAAGIQEWINKTNDSGFAAKTAATKMDNLAGDLTKLKGSLDTALIQGGSGATAGLRGLTQAVTGVVNAYMGLPRSVQGGLFAVTGFTGAALLGAAALVFMAKTVREARVALEALGVTGPMVASALTKIRAGMAALFATNAALNSTVLGLGRALNFAGGILTGPWGLAVAGAVALLFAFQTGKKKAAQATEEFVTAIKADSGAIGENTRAAVANRLEHEGLLKTAQLVGVDLPTVTDAVLGNGKAYNEVSDAVDTYARSLLQKKGGTKEEIENNAKLFFGAQQLKTALKDQSGELKESVSSTQRQTSATKESTDAVAEATGTQAEAVPVVSEHAKAEQALADAMSDTTKTAKDLQDALDALAGANISAIRAAIAQRAAVKAAGEASDHRAGLTDKESGALADLAEHNGKVIVSMKAQHATGDQLAAKHAQLAQEFIKMARYLGLDAAAAKKLATDLGQLTSVSTITSGVMSGFIVKATGLASAQQHLASKTGTGQHAQEAYRASVQQSLPVLYALTNGHKGTIAQVDALARANGLATGATNTTRKSFLAAADAMGFSAGKAKALWTALQKIKSKKVGVVVTATGTWKTSTAGLSSSRIAQEFVGSAKGGPIPSLGPESSRAYDSVPALLRVDEHVWTPEEVDAVGGHSQMYRLRQAALQGKLQKFARGGAVMSSPGVSSAAVTGAVMAPINAGFNSMISNMAAAFAAAWKKFAGSGGSVVAAARSQIGLPYSWGGGGTGGPSYGIGRGAGTYGFDCSGLTEFAWWKGRHKDIGGVTDSQWANSTPISGPRPGALAFPHGPGVHVMLGSNKPGYVIQAPHTGAFVEEVPRSSSNWRWPTGLASGGEVRLGERISNGRASRHEAMLAKALQIAGSGPRGAERHTAQIAPAGDMRLWAEPETGGEAYIPLANSKRTRSKQILAAVARTFGMSVRGMADGGIIGMADGGIPDVNLSDILSSWSTAVDPATSSDVTDAKSAQKTQSGQVTAAIAALKKAKQARADRIHDAEKRLARAEASKGKGRANAIADAKEALAKAKRTDTITKAEAKLKKEREDLATATKKLGEVEKKYQYAKQSPATQLGSALGLSIKNKGAFIANLTKLADRGFGVLAQQLLTMGGTEAEKIAADAVKFSNAKLGTLQGQVQTAATQQQTLENLPNILTVRSAAKKLGGKSSSWKAMLDATGLDPGSLATAVHLMAGDLGKSTSGKALLADMKTHGYVRGGWIGGVSGVDRNLISATAGEFMVKQRQASKYGPLIEAINNDRVGDAMLRRYIRGTGGGSGQVRGGDGASAPVVHQTFNHPEMNVSQLARESAREAAWMLG